MRAIAVSCPRCGAALRVGDDADEVTCQYCGTSAQVQRRSRVLQVPRAMAARDPARVVARQRVSWLVLVPVLIMGLALAAGGFFASRVAGRASRAAAPTHGQVAGRTAAAEPVAAWAGDVPLAAYVDHDGAADLVGRVRYIQDGDRVHLTAIAGATGDPLWESERLGGYGELGPGLIAIRGELVLLAGVGDRLDGFERATGARRWSLAMGDKVETVCAGPGDDEVVVMTADERWWLVDAAGGKRPTTALLRFERPFPFRGRELARFRAVGSVAPPDLCQRLDNRSWDGPVGLLSLGSRATLPRLPGVDVRRLIRRPGGMTIAIGARTPGTPVPMLAALDRDAVRWSIAIPSSTPLEARADDAHVALSDRVVTVVYQVPGPTPVRVAAFALADGIRTWEAAVPAARTSTSVTGVTAIGGLVVVTTSTGLFAFDVGTGRLRFRIGDA